MNGYVGFYKGKRIEVYSASQFEAQRQAAKLLGVKKYYDVAIILAEINGIPVQHGPGMLGA